MDYLMGQVVFDRLCTLCGKAGVVFVANNVGFTMSGVLHKGWFTNGQYVWARDTGARLISQYCCHQQCSARAYQGNKRVLKHKGVEGWGNDELVANKIKWYIYQGCALRRLDLNWECETIHYWSSVVNRTLMNTSSWNKKVREVKNRTLLFSQGKENIGQTPTDFRPKPVPIGEPSP